MGTGKNWGGLMRYLSLFSGIEAATVAWKSLGWKCVAVSEIEPFPCAVLAHYYPGTPNLGDVTKITETDIKNLGQIDLVVFGSPCTDLSVAGKREGLQGKASGLFYEAIRIIQWARKHCGLRYALWENVPGAFSSNKGRDFAEVVSQMAGLKDIDTPKYGWGKEGAAVGNAGMLEWRVLDAQWFGLAQRRKRVFAVIDFGDWNSRPPILLERESMRGNTSPSRETQKAAAPDAKKCTARSCEKVSKCLTSHGQRLDAESESFVVESVAPCLRNNGLENIVTIAGNVIGRGDKTGGNGNGFDESGVCYTLTSTDRHAVAFKERAGCAGGGKGFLGKDECTFTLSTVKDQNIFVTNTITDVSGTLTSGHGGRGVDMDALASGQCVVTKTSVRRLTPLECERLQGFPDNYTRIAYRNKPKDECPDGPRYKALGNSMAVPVMRWIGEQIQRAVDYKEIAA